MSFVCTRRKPRKSTIGSHTERRLGWLLGLTVTVPPLLPVPAASHRCRSEIPVAPPRSWRGAVSGTSSLLRCRRSRCATKCVLSIEHLLGTRTADGIYAVGDDTFSGIVNAYSKKHTNFVRSAPVTEARVPTAPWFFATRRSEEALRSVIHRGFLAFCSAAIKPLPLKVTHARLLIKMVIRYFRRRADGTRPMSFARCS